MTATGLPGRPDEGHAADLAEGDRPPRPNGEAPEVKMAESLHRGLT